MKCWMFSLGMETTTVWTMFEHRRHLPALHDSDFLKGERDFIFRWDTLFEEDDRARTSWLRCQGGVGVTLHLVSNVPWACRAWAEDWVCVFPAEPQSLDVHSLDALTVHFLGLFWEFWEFCIWFRAFEVEHLVPGSLILTLPWLCLPLAHPLLSKFSLSPQNVPSPVRSSFECLPSFWHWICIWI